MGDIDGRSKSKVSLAGKISIATTAKSTTTIGASATSRMRVRQPSFGFGRVSGIRPVERTSQIAIEFKRPVLTYLPTYQMEPYIPFHATRTTEVVKEYLELYFEGHKYHPQETPSLALRLAGDIMRRLKTMFNRYRIISVVTVGQKRSQCYNNGISLLWDPIRDEYVDIHKENPSIFVQVTVFGIYLD